MGRARRPALVLVDLGPVEEHCTGERSLSFDARPWFDVSAAAWNAKSAAACEASARAPVLAVSGEEVQYPSLLRAHRATLVRVCLCPLER